MVYLRLTKSSYLYVRILAPENTHKHTLECTKLNGAKGIG